MDSKGGRITVEFSFGTIFIVLGIILLLWATFELREILVSVLLAFILAVAISPLVDLLQKKKVPRSLSISVIYLLIVLAIVLLVRVVIPPVVGQLGSIYDNKGAYIDTIASYFGSLGPAFKTNTNSVVNKISAGLSSATFSGIFSSARGIIGGFVDAILVFVLSFYFLLSKNGLPGVITAYIPKQHQKRTLAIYRKISLKMSYWLRGQVALGLIIFAVNWLGLSLLHVKYSLTLAIVSGILEILPIIGPWIAGIMAVVVALTQSPLLALAVAIWFVVVQQLENHIIVPQVMKKSLGLSPIVIILSILIGGNLLGVIGILISVPIASAVSILLEEFVKIKEETEDTVGN